YQTVWDERPWTHRERSSGTFYATYNQSVDELGPLHFELTERADLHLADHVRVIRTDYVVGPSDRQDLDFPEAKGAIVLPSSGQRGSGLDLTLSILLGLTP